MNTPLLVIQVTSAIVMSISILLQQRGTGLGAAFGGTSNVYRTKRGIDHVLLWVTIVTAFTFGLSSFLTVIY